MSLVAVLPWIAVLGLLAVLALPTSAWTFADWPDGGASMAPAVALAVLTLVGFWVGHISMGFLPILAGAAVLGGLSVLSLRAGVGVPTRNALAPLAVFVGAFALYLFVRATDPGLTPGGGEQFLDVGLIYAVRRAGSLPPQDVWFAGEPLRYYYAGPLLTGLLSRVTATPVHVAYNLMGPTVFAALVTAAYGLTGSIASARGTAHHLAGLLGALLVAFAGTLATPLRGLSSFLPRDLAAEYGRFLYGAIREDYEEAVDAARFLDGGEFSYWLGRYVIPDAPNVFPFWTYVNGDLRPHMYAGPFFLLAVALTFAYYRTPAADRTRRRILALGALPAVAGLLGLVNTFDLPAAVGLAWLAVLFARADPWSLLPESLLPTAVRERLPRTRSRANGGVGVGSTRPLLGGRQPLAARLADASWRLLGATGVAIGMAVLAAAWAAPVLLSSPANRGVALLGPTSNLGGLLLVFGGFLVAFALWLGPQAIDGSDRWLWATLAVALLALLGLSTLLGYPAVGLFAPLVVGGWWLLGTGRARSFAVVLVVAGAGLVLVPEFAYARIWPYDPNAPRWNTIYKISLQVWTVWGVAGGVALAAVLGRTRDVVAAGASAMRRRPGQVAAGLLAVVLIALVATFPAFALASQVDDATGPDGDLALSLNGTATLAEHHPNELAAARWLREETTGQPTMVSRPAGRVIYNWDAGANAASTFSGVPTVVGWEHVAGYHGIEPFERRLADVETFYTGNATEVRQFVRTYDVEYVYVGPAEREAYGPRVFSVEIPWMEEVYRNTGVRIYEVDQAAMESNDP